MKKNKGNILVGLVFIAFGALWLLNNLNIVQFEFRYIFVALRNLWPLILVVIGLNIIIKNNFLNKLVWILFIAAILIFSYYLQENGSHFGPNIINVEDNIINTEDAEYHNIPLQGVVSSGKLDLDFGAADFYIQSGTGDFAAVDSNMPRLSLKEEIKGKQQNLYISNENFSFDTFGSSSKNNDHRYLNVVLNEDIPWDIDIDSGAVKGMLNLDNITIDELDIDLGAGDIEVYLGENAQNASINIDTGVSSIILNIPEECGILVEIDGALNSTNLSELDLIKETDNKYVSKNYQEAKSKYTIDIDMGLGDFQINYY